MNFLKRILARVFGRYEGAVQRWGERSWLPASIQDARLDADSMTRQELLRRSRYWARNSAIVNRLVDLFEQFTVGPSGLQLIPSSSLESFNAAASEWWQGWCKFPDLVSLQPFGILQTLIARRWFEDGEVFLIKSYGGDGTGMNQGSRPRLQMIEAHRVKTPTDMSTEEGKFPGVVDGVQVDANGRPVGYYVQFGADKDKTFRLIAAADMVHVFEPERPGQYRGLPFLYPVLNDLHDLEDLQMLEMQAAKQAAQITNVITNATGEADVSQMRRLRLQITTQDKSGNPQTKEIPQYYKTVLGANTLTLKTGEDIKQFMSNRPSVATRDYWDYLTSKICAGVGISRLLVFPYSMQGTVTRADLDVSNAFFRSRSAVIETACRNIYEWVIGWAVKWDRNFTKAPNASPLDWYRVTVRPPRAVNVDVGRNSSAMIQELEAGTRTYADVYAEQGQDWREQMDQRGLEAYTKAMLAKKWSKDGIVVTPEQIGMLGPPPALPKEGQDVPVKQEEP